MKKIIKVASITMLTMLFAALPVFAEGNGSDGGITVKAIAAAVIITVAAAAGAFSMAIAIKNAEESTARQPEAAGSIRTLMMMGLVFIETAIIYALITAIIIIFVL